VYHKTNNLKTFAPSKKEFFSVYMLEINFQKWTTKKVKEEEEEVSWLNGNTGLPFL
jgi:hypothetical protein